MLGYSAAESVWVTLMFFGILSLTILLVVMRYGFNSSIMGANEAMEYLFIYTTALGAAAPAHAKTDDTAGRQEAGYRETEHVRRVYALSRF